MALLRHLFCVQKKVLKRNIKGFRLPEYKLAILLALTFPISALSHNHQDHCSLLIISQRLQLIAMFKKGYLNYLE